MSILVHKDDLVKPCATDPEQAGPRDRDEPEGSPSQVTRSLPGDGRDRPRHSRGSLRGRRGGATWWRLPAEIAAMEEPGVTHAAHLAFPDPGGW